MKHVAHILERKALVEGGDALDQLIERFLRNHDVCELSRHGYRRRLRDFRKWITALGKPTIDREVLVAYRRSLRTRKFAAYTQSSYMVALRVFFTWLEAEKITPNFAKGLKGAPRDRSFRKDAFSIGMVFKILNSIDRSTLIGKRDFALLNTLIRLGPRPIELARADVDDLRSESNQMVLWLQGKGRLEKDHFCCVLEDVLQPIMEYLEARGNPKASEPLFASVSDRGRNQRARLTTRGIRGIVKRRLRNVNLNSPRLSAGSARHTAATLVLAAGGTLEDAKDLLAHQSTTTTQIYARQRARSLAIPERHIDDFLKQEIRKEDGDK
jgi:site-specific recombinase XerD